MRSEILADSAHFLGFKEMIYSTRSSTSSGFRMKLGIVGCGTLRNVRKENSVAEGSTAIAEKLGASGFADDWFRPTP